MFGRTTASTPAQRRISDPSTGLQHLLYAPSNDQQLPINLHSPAGDEALNCWHDPAVALVRLKPGAQPPHVVGDAAATAVAEQADHPVDAQLERRHLARDGGQELIRP